MKATDQPHELINAGGGSQQDRNYISFQALLLSVRGTIRAGNFGVVKS